MNLVLVGITAVLSLFFFVLSFSMKRGLYWLTLSMIWLFVTLFAATHLL